jgi:Zn-dependent protease with chaperone function
LIPFLLEVAGVALAVGFGLSALWPVVLRVTRGWSAGRRADALFIAATLPFGAAAGLSLALLIPTALDLFGMQGDHCHAHDHGLHLCGVHGGVHGPLLGLGALLSAVVGARLLLTARQLRRAAVDVDALVQLGDRRGEVIVVPSTSALCLATGVLRPRVLLSAGLRDGIGEPALLAALAHERAHLRRRDPAALWLLQVALSFGLPGSGILFAFRAAADEAADAEAAQEVGAVPVADALVRMARFMRQGPDPLSPATLAFGSHPLERRVRLLLSGPLTPVKARGLGLSAALSVGALLLSALGAEPIHHLVEDLLLAHH